MGAGPVYSRGHRDVTALCAGGAETPLYATDATPTGRTSSNPITEGGDYGTRRPARWSRSCAEEGGLGGCAAAGRCVFLGALDGSGCTR